MRTCPRCCKQAEGIHTCTPTPEWRKLEKQRDELLAALEELLSEVEGCGACSEKKALAAIASVKGETS